MKRNSIKHQQTSSTTNFTSDEDEDSFIGEDFWDDEPFDDELDVSENKITKHKTLLSTSIYDSISLPSSDRSRTYPVACVVSYAYEVGAPGLHAPLSTLILLFRQLEQMS